MTGGRGRGRGRGGSKFARTTQALSMRKKKDGEFTMVSKQVIAAGSAGGKSKLVDKCTLRFSSNVPQDLVDSWFKKYRQVWPAPNGGFKDANITVFWDIENCRPDPSYAPMPLHYAMMLREAFKTSVDARTMRCIAALSVTYPTMPLGGQGSGAHQQLSYQKLMNLNAQAGYMNMLSVPGKKAEAVHKDWREADDTLKTKMGQFLEESTPGDVAVIISGDGGFTSFAAQAKSKGINVIVLGPSINSTNADLLAVADLFMEWPAFARFHGKKQMSVPVVISPKVEEQTAKLIKSHVELYSSVKELDLVVLLDISGSMECYLDGVRGHIKDVLEQIAVRFPWAKQHMRVGLVGYRDFMCSTRTAELEPQPFVVSTLGGPDDVTRMLANVEVAGGADAAEDVVGGLLKVADMLAVHGRGRNCVLFHICDAPNHGREFNDYHETKYGCDPARLDSYPDGPLKPCGSAVPPPGRTKPWRQEAKEVLLRLKDELKVVKYTMLSLVEPGRVCPTDKMLAEFRRMVGDPLDATEGWNWRKAHAADQAAGAAPLAEPADPWISAMQSEKVEDSKLQQTVSDNLVRMMVGTTLGMITRLSQLVYDGKKGVRSTKKRERGTSVTLETLAECDEAGDEELGKLASNAENMINSQAVEVAIGALEDEASTNSGSGMAASITPVPGPGGVVGGGSNSKKSDLTSTAYKEAQLNKMRSQLIGRLRRKMSGAGSAITADEIHLVPPPSLDDLIWGLLDGIRVQQSGCSEDQLPNLLAPEVLAGQLKYYKALRACAEGMQRLAYEAVREEDVKGKKDKALSVVMMKEFKDQGAGLNSKTRYLKMCQANVVAAYLADLFNEECVERGVDKVDGLPRPDLVYMPMWVASWDMRDPKVEGGVRRCNHHVEPYILGKYIKYLSNNGGIETSALNDVCMAFAHWTYEATKGYLMVTDVQGVKDHAQRKIFLTDPAIHCVPLIDGYFDKESSRGPIGVKEFFLTHTCNDTCKKLGLMDAKDALAKLRAEALQGKLPGRAGAPLDLDAGL